MNMKAKPPLRVAGLISSGKVRPDPAKYNPVDLHAPTAKQSEHREETGFVESTQSSHQKIALDLIDDSPYQPRDLYDLEDIDNLGHSMAASGQDEQITVRQMSSGRYELIKGHRRTRAARSLGWTHIEADIVVKTDREAKLSAMISNEGRVDLTDYERGKLYREAQESGYAKSQDELAHLFGTTQTLVSMRILMLDLPENIITLLERNPRLFGASTAKDIRRLMKEHPTQTELVEKAVERIVDGANESSITAWVNQMLKQKSIPNEAVVPDKSGRTIFKTKLVGREFTIQIKDNEIDANEIKEMVLVALRQRAETILTKVS